MLQIEQKVFSFVLVYWIILTIQQRAEPSVPELFPQLNVFQGTFTLECILSGGYSRVSPFLSIPSILIRPGWGLEARKR